MANQPKKNDGHKKKAKTGKAGKAKRSTVEKQRLFTQVVVFVMIGALLLSGLVAGIGTVL